ncbi:MAG: substrate-binding domain-containing protein [Hyphomicrobiaceae bacterium]
MTGGAKTGAVSILSSMATRQILKALVERCRMATGVGISVESLGGVDAARRVRAGEAVDLVLLAADAMTALSDDGFVVSDSIRAFARSPVAVAVRSGRPHPASCDEASLKALISASGRVGLSTGPSGRSVAQLLENWRRPGSAAHEVLLAPPGVPVARLIANGDVDIGFQQLSELLGEPGIEIVGTIPETVQPATVFSVGRSVRAGDPAAARAVIEFLNSSETASIKREFGMEPG